MKIRAFGYGTVTFNWLFGGVGCLQWRTQEFCSGGVQQIQLRTKGRENGDLGAVPPSQGFH
jgi:hypothetical protein